MRGFLLGLSFVFFMAIGSFAQREPDHIYMPSIKTIKLNRFGDQLSYPIIALMSNERLELNFDDLDADVKAYYYTFELRNADWSPVQMSYFDYVKGFTQVRITTYRNSFLSLTPYTHYQAVLPDRNCYPTKSGNYLLKVFLNGDTSQLAFTRRILVTDNRISIAAQVTQPFNQQYFQTHHRMQVQVNTRGFDVRYPQQQMKVAILQNYRWDNKLEFNTPTFVRQEMLQYNNENEMVMPAVKEWRWVNLRSFRLLGDRVSSQKNTDSSFTVFVQEEKPRIGQQYFFFNDQNGMFINETTENINPFWNADYASVHFQFKPPGGLPFSGKDLYLIGEMTNYGEMDSAKLRFNPAVQAYETTLFLKQGYYDYLYATRDIKADKGPFYTELTENNSWETENLYIFLVYFRDLGGRYDQLVGITRLNSMFRNVR
jgi:Domain of unknown function (DUF5103)